MNINETINLNAQITLKDTNGNMVVAAYVSANIDGGNQNINTTINVSNKDLITANATDAQTQFTDFETAVKARAKELGFGLFA
ncbi:hypothetical protein [Clostridium coskatii]|uniref:Uncharacterized protein n=1 Tax=Clostridium coskatii TaxID=1705578 RepID=A0A162L3P6_9CLOT|nr:hypothetical protein [Clostridium coskatii]OAA90702.1 hypothetical protein WX73_02067 [Clostridium coskatii]OBR97462.1 hypothetical protein CLCOS_03180 [Clostridium coskatii]